jgi:hypothetical protein
MIFNQMQYGLLPYVTCIYFLPIHPPIYLINYLPTYLLIFFHLHITYLHIIYLLIHPLIYLNLAIIFKQGLVIMFNHNFKPLSLPT